MSILQDYLDAAYAYRDHLSKIAETKIRELQELFDNCPDSRAILIPNGSNVFIYDPDETYEPLPPSHTRTLTITPERDYYRIKFKRPKTKSNKTIIYIVNPNSPIKISYDTTRRGITGINGRMKNPNFKLESFAINEIIRYK